MKHSSFKIIALDGVYFDGYRGEGIGRRGTNKKCELQRVGMEVGNEFNTDIFFDSLA